MCPLLPVPGGSLHQRWSRGRGECWPPVLGGGLPGASASSSAPSACPRVWGPGTGSAGSERARFAAASLPNWILINKSQRPLISQWYLFGNPVLVSAPRELPVASPVLDTRPRPLSTEETPGVGGHDGVQSLCFSRRSKEGSSRPHLCPSTPFSSAVTVAFPEGTWDPVTPALNSLLY